MPTKKLKYMSDSGVLEEDETNAALDAGIDVSDHNQEDTGGEQDSGIALISDGHSVSESCDDTVDNSLDDDFYDEGEFYEDAYGEGAPDTGF